MVKSTIDDIKDITLERQIRKLAGVIDKQNEVIASVGNVDTRLTAVEDSTANNTVQINSVKVDVAKNTTAIENISNRVTNVEQSTEAIPGIQTEITGINNSLVSNVTATFDNPSRELKISLGREASTPIDATVVIPASSETGQYSAGNGITIESYQIAVDTGVVALKSDIPVVPDVTELTQRVQTLETEMPTKASVDSVNALEATVNSNTQNITTLTESVNGKVAIAQGTENAGKVLGIGSDGNVTPVNAGGGSGGGEVWEEVDLQNFPNDWKVGDRVKIQIKSIYTVSSPNSWTTTPSASSGTEVSNPTNVIELRLSDTETPLLLLCIEFPNNKACNVNVCRFYSAESWNTGNIANPSTWQFNGAGLKIIQSSTISRNSIATSNRIAMWRLKK